MSEQNIIVLGAENPEEHIRGELDRALGGERQRKYRRFLMEVMSSFPWIGGVLAAMAATDSEREQHQVNELQQEWLDVHRERLDELKQTLLQIFLRLESLGPEIEARVQSDDYLKLVRKAFRVWDQADTNEKRKLIQNLLTNAGGTPLTADDVVRLFIQWIDHYHEAHFAVIRAIFKSPGCTRAEMWDLLHGTQVAENSAEADLFKRLIRDLSTDGVIRQHRETTADGEFLRRQPTRTPKRQAPRVIKSAFDDTEQYELTEMGRQFVHYTMNEVVPRLGRDRT